MHAVTPDFEFSRIYVNVTTTWKIRNRRGPLESALIDEEFNRLMFGVREV